MSIFLLSAFEFLGKNNGALMIRCCIIHAVQLQFRESGTEIRTGIRGIRRPV
jgi:hypothetical protein